MNGSINWALLAPSGRRCHQLGLSPVAAAPSAVKPAAAAPEISTRLHVELPSFNRNCRIPELDLANDIGLGVQ
jgi:hypothetical protein